MGKQHSAMVTGAVTLLMAKGFFVWSQNTGGARYPKKDGGVKWVRFGKKGQADIIGMTPKGRFIGVEIKVGKDTLSDDQIEFEAEVKRRGGIYLVVRDLLRLMQWAVENRSV